MQYSYFSLSSSLVGSLFSVVLWVICLFRLHSSRSALIQHGVTNQHKRLCGCVYERALWWYLGSWAECGAKLRNVTENYGGLCLERSVCWCLNVFLLSTNLRTKKKQTKRWICDLECTHCSSLVTHTSSCCCKYLLNHCISINLWLKIDSSIYLCLGKIAQKPQHTGATLCCVTPSFHTYRRRKVKILEASLCPQVGPNLLTDCSVFDFVFGSRHVFSLKDFRCSCAPLILLVGFWHASWSFLRTLMLNDAKVSAPPPAALRPIQRLKTKLYANQPEADEAGFSQTADQGIRETLPALEREWKTENCNLHTVWIDANLTWRG